MRLLLVIVSSFVFSIQAVTTPANVAVVSLQAVLLQSAVFVEAKKNPWKKTVGKAQVKPPFYKKVYADFVKQGKTTYSWALKKISKSEFSEANLIATQIFAAGMWLF